VLCLSAHGETPAPPTSSLDAARRDLRELPVTERTRDNLGKSSGFGTADLPALTLPGSGDSPQNKPEPNAPPSPTWLLDALKQTDAERSQRRPNPDAILARDQANGYKPVPAPDPLAQYLGQWMSPRDQELLRPDTKKSADLSTKGPLELTARMPEMSGLPALQTGLMPVSIVEPAKNPYLQEPTPQPLPPNPLTPASVTRQLPNDRSRVPLAFPVGSTPTGLSTTPSSVKPAVKPLEPATVLPTAPIIDDRKYFPQLHRF
jgi:hypothetical protein